MNELAKKRLNQARILIEEERWQEALLICAEEKADAGDFRILEMQAYCQLKQDEPIEAQLRWLDSLKADHPVYVLDRYSSKFAILLEKAGRHEQAGRLLLMTAARQPWSTMHYRVASSVVRNLRPENETRILIQKHLKENINLINKDELRAKSSTFAFAPFSELEYGSFAAPSKFQISATISGCFALDMAPLIQSLLQEWASTRMFYPRAPYQVMQLDNVRVNQVGQVWTPEGKAIISLRRHVEEMDKPASDFLEIDDAVPPMSGDNIFHWLGDMIPLIGWMAHPAARHVRILMRPKAPKYKLDSLRFAGFAPDQIVEMKSPAYSVKRLYLAFDPAHPAEVAYSLFYFGHRFTLSGIRLLQNIMLGARKEATLPHGSRLLYISRRDSNQRKMKNELLLEEGLKERGFYVAEMSKLSLADQITLVSTSSMIVAPHGAGLTHLLFAPPSIPVIEILPAAKDISKDLIRARLCYARVAMMKGLHHRIFLQAWDSVVEPWTVDLEKLFRVVDAELEQLSAPAAE